MTARRELKRQYLEVASRAGVYAIRNLVTGLALVAGSANVQGALNRHLFELRQGKHRDARLLEDWKAHGEGSFVFEVLDQIKPRPDPDFDTARELELLVALWRLEVPCGGERGYGT